MKYSYSFVSGRLLEKDLENDNHCDHSLKFLRNVYHNSMMKKFLKKEPNFITAHRMIFWLQENYPEELL